MNSLVERLIKVVPSKRQLLWHDLEFYSFIHFGMNTFYDSEWGNGQEDPSKFNPTALDTDQWIESLKLAGIKAAILTCKHHDGFCLWPSKHTEHSVKNSPYKDGKGDIVREMAESCKKYGIQFGVYLSPWDRHDKRYGDSPAYNDYFIAQLTELLTEYGEVFSVWFDGACGEGENGKRQEYDWERYYELIRKLQPNAAITICGPDVRWCGNEAGDCRKSEWNVIPSRLARVELTSSLSQQADDESFRERKISSVDQDLGSREILKEEQDLIWYPAEVDTSIRPGWFYHEAEDDQVKSLEKLLSIYYNSVGGNASLLLNIPPDKRGLIHENDVKRLKEIGEYLENTFKHCITDDAKESSFVENEVLNLIYDFEEAKAIHHVVLREDLKYSQRIESFELFVETKDGLSKIYEGTVVGSKKICKFDLVETSKLVIRIIASRSTPMMNFVGIYANK